MSGNSDFMTLIFLGIGVMTVFALIANLTGFGVSGPWAEVNVIIAPLVIVICFIGFIAYLVANR